LADGYADAGVVVDLGPASSFNGIHLTGSDNLVDHIWIGDNAQTYTPGTHVFATDPVKFSYGFDNGNNKYWMTAGPYTGQTLGIPDIRADFAGYAVYAWVGIVTNGTSATGHVSQVNGMGAGANFSVKKEKGVTTVSAR
jgi:hypothetical protein